MEMERSRLASRSLDGQREIKQNGTCVGGSACSTKGRFLEDSEVRDAASPLECGSEGSKSWQKPRMARKGLVF